MTVRNRLLSITRNVIPYIKELRPYAGSVAACILMQQLDYWFDHYPDGFYKFMQPSPNNEHYRPGDSWAEELALSSDEFRTAFDRIGVRYTSKTAYDKAVNKFSTPNSTTRFYCSYHDKIRGLTYYFRNHELVDATLDEIVLGQRTPTPPTPVNRESPSTEVGNPHLRKQTTPTSVNRDCPSHIYTEITSEITPDNLSPLTPQEELEAKREREKFGNQKLEKPGNGSKRTSLAALPSQPELLEKEIITPGEDSHFGGASLNGDEAIEQSSKTSGLNPSDSFESSLPSNVVPFGSFKARFPWETTILYEFEPGFEEYMLKRFESCSLYQGKRHSEKLTMIRKYINAARFSNEAGRLRSSELWIEWNGFEQEKASIANKQQQTTQPLGQTATTTCPDIIPENFSAIQHEELAKEYVADPKKFLSIAPWRSRWLKYMNSHPGHKKIIQAAEAMQNGNITEQVQPDSTRRGENSANVLGGRTSNSLRNPVRPGSDEPGDRHISL